MSAHTPGPWTFKPQDGSDLGGFLGPAGECVCSFGDEEDYYPTEGQPPSEADARLIAAAPDLLAAARAVVESTKASDGLEIAPTRSSVEALAAAIAKAESSK